MGALLPHEPLPALELTWQENEGHAGFAWSTRGIISQQTERLHLGATVTCPPYRERPGGVAQPFATFSLFAPGCVNLGLAPLWLLGEERVERG